MNYLNKRNNIITYSIIKSNLSHCYVSINGSDITVNAPWYFSRKQIQSIIEEKSHWILEKIQEYKSQIYEIDNFFIFGKQTPLAFYYKNIKAPHINVKKNNVEVILPIKFKKVEKEYFSKLIIDKLYNKIADKNLEYFTEKARITLNLAPESVEIKKLANSTLAICNTDEKKIIINPDIMKFDKDIINYIIFHEFCHLKYKIHTKNFWKLIEEHIPNYKEYMDLLKDFNI